MTPDEQNRFVHEKIMGKCWHEMSTNMTIVVHCIKCGNPRHLCKNPDYTQPEHYWEVLKKLIKEQDFHKIIFHEFYKESHQAGLIEVFKIILDPPRGLASICEFFGKEKI